MSSTDNFLQITGCGNRDLARKYLAQSGGRIDLAIDNYYNQQGSSSNNNNNSNKNNSFNSTSAIPSNHAMESLTQVFSHYAEPSDPNKMDIDGTIAYFTDLNIDVENDVEAIIAAYLLESPSTGVFNKKSFLNNWAKVNALTIPDMTLYLHKVKSDNSLMDQVNKFAFEYALEKGQRKLNIDDAVALWRIVYKDILQSGIETTASKFIEDFIASGESGKTTISKDEWIMSRAFFAIPLSELFELTEDAAWPVLMDEFVDFIHN